MPSRLLVMIASKDESTMLANSMRASLAPFRSVMSAIDAIHPTISPDGSCSGLYTTCSVRLPTLANITSVSYSTGVPASTRSTVRPDRREALLADGLDNRLSMELARLPSEHLRVGGTHEHIAQVAAAPRDHERRVVDQPVAVSSSSSASICALCPLVPSELMSLIMRAVC